MSLAMGVQVAGASFIWPLNAIYVHEVLGKSLTTAGILLFFNAGAGALGSLVGGRAFDRWGHRPILLGGAFVAVLTALAMALFPSFLLYGVLLTFFGFGTGLIYPAMYALAGILWPEGGRRAFAAVYVAANAGVAAGTAAAGFVASIGFQWSFTASSLFFAAFMLMVAYSFRGGRFGRRGQADVPAVGEGIAWNRSLFLLSLGFFLAWSVYVQWQTTIATFLQASGYSLSQYSLLWTLNGGLILVGQPLLNHLWRGDHLRRQMLLGIGLYGVVFALLGFSLSYGGYVFLMGLMTVGEIMVWPAVPAAAQSLAPKGQEGAYQGAVGSAASLGRMVGPLLGGWIYDTFPWKVLSFSMVGLLLVSLWIFSRIELRERRVPLSS
ncbi:MAG: MFS transporter [Bacillota bacterium]|nr:MFS transporter [Bacillota bacterium]